MSNINLKASDVELAKILVKEFGKTGTRKEVVPFCDSNLDGAYRAYNIMRIVGKKNPAVKGEYDISNLVKDVKAGIKAGGLVKGAPAKPRGAKVAKAAGIAMTAPLVREKVEVEAKVIEKMRSDEIHYEAVVVPAIDPNFIPYGNFSDTRQLIKSGVFAPAFIMGHSGYGKTTLVEQVCAKLKRTLIPCQITEETCEDDLIGGMRLINGNTVFEYGPAAMAYKTGSVLLLDEIDQGTSKIMCLQNLLQAKPIFIKKTGETLYPTEGFMVLATGNTKGIGDDADGRYVGAKVMNEAFLERFSDMMTQEAPSAAIETKILNKVIDDADFVEKLVKWANLSRDAVEAGTCDREIQTRRLLHIAKNFQVYGNRLKAVQKACNRFDADTKDALVDLYTKVDSGAELKANETVAAF